MVACAVTIAFLGSIGCSSTATITRMSGPTLEARIDGSDDQRLYVTTRSDARYMVERPDVISIDHPGNVVGLIGLTYVAFGALMFFGTNSPSTGERGSGFEGIPRGMGLTSMVVGLPVAILGGANYLRSVLAAQPAGAPVPR